MNDIKAGDLVVVVKPSLCCGRTKGIGRIFTVQAVSLGTLRCTWCGFTSPVVVAETGWVNPRTKRFIATPLARLKKIPPLADPVEERAHDEVPA